MGMKLVKVWGSETVHAVHPETEGEVGGWDPRISLESTYCGRPYCGCSPRQKLVPADDAIGVTCKRCRQLMDHWARRPQA